jgi:CRISPR-associated protein Cmr4
VVVDDDEIAAVHDMALYRQSRVALDPKQKVVAKGAFFNVEALPEGTVLVFPVGVKSTNQWAPFDKNKMSGDLYLGGLESVGFGHCRLDLAYLP